MLIIPSRTLGGFSLPVLTKDVNGSKTVDGQDAFASPVAQQERSVSTIIACESRELLQDATALCLAHMLVSRS
jgi:hypothetical protein